MHQFYKEQPDLNLRNPIVRNELKNVLEFWLDLGVAGFRIDAVPHFFEDERFLDEDVVDGKEPESYDSVTRKYSYNLQPEVNDLLNEFREVLDKYSEADGIDRYVRKRISLFFSEYWVSIITFSKINFGFFRILMTEAYVGNEELMEYYGTISNGVGSIAQLPINFCLVSGDSNTNAKKVI